MCVVFELVSLSLTSFMLHDYYAHCSMFSENEAPGGTLGAGFINVQFFEENVFLNNIGPALRVGVCTTLCVCCSRSTWKFFFLDNDYLLNVVIVILRREREREREKERALAGA